MEACQVGFLKVRRIPVLKNENKKCYIRKEMPTVVKIYLAWWWYMCRDVRRAESCTIHVLKYAIFAQTQHVVVPSPPSHTMRVEYCVLKKKRKEKKSKKKTPVPSGLKLPQVHVIVLRVLVHGIHRLEVCLRADIDAVTQCGRSRVYLISTATASGLNSLSCCLA